MCWYLQKKKSVSWQSLFSSWNWNKNGSNLLISKLDTCHLPLAASRRSPSDKVDCFNGGPWNGCKDIVFASNVTADVCALTVRGERPLTDFQEKLEICANQPDSPPTPRVGWEPPKYKKINVPLHSKLFWAFYFFFFVSLKFSQNVGFWGSYEISSPLLIVVCVSLHLWNPRPDCTQLVVVTNPPFLRISGMGGSHK